MELRCTRAPEAEETGAGTIYSSRLIICIIVSKQLCNYYGAKISMTAFMLTRSFQIEGISSGTRRSTLVLQLETRPRSSWLSTSFVPVTACLRISTQQLPLSIRQTGEHPQRLSAGQAPRVRHKCHEVGLLLDGCWRLSQRASENNGSTARASPSMRPANARHPRLERKTLADDARATTRYQPRNPLV